MLAAPRGASDAAWRRMQPSVPDSRMRPHVAVTPGGSPSTDSLHRAGETLAAVDAGKDNSARSRRQQALVGVERQQEIGLAAGRLEEVDKSRPAALVNVADFDHVAPGGGGGPAFDARIGVGARLVCGFTYSVKSSFSASLLLLASRMRRTESSSD